VDEYGGRVENLMRLLQEVVESLIEVWGEHRVAVRLSPENSYNDMSDSQPERTFTAVIKMLSAYPLAYLHVLEGDMATGESALDYNKLRQSFSGLYMANNAYDQARASSALEKGTADMVAFGKLFIANPDLPERFALGAPMNPLDVDTLYGGDEKGYIDYPRL